MQQGSNLQDTSDVEKVNQLVEDFFEGITLADLCDEPKNDGT